VSAYEYHSTASEVTTLQQYDGDDDDDDDDVQ